MDVQLFDFILPEELIAQTPLSDRSGSRLLTLNKKTGDIAHHQFADLLEYVQAGDALIINDTKVLPARLYGTKADTGAKVEVLLLKHLGSDAWEVLIKPAKRAKLGTILQFGEGTAVLTAEVTKEGEMGQRELQFSYEGIFYELLDRLGEMPLPPYIKEQLSNKERYQTIYAQVEGSAAAPTAGLHFTQAFLEQIKAKGVAIAPLTLHVGLGTFRPVSANVVEEHEMHEEYFELSAETAEIINETRQRGGRVIAVGTTSARTLETVASRSSGGQIQPMSGWTNIFIYPGYTFQLVDALITNFHLPKSTLVMLVSALAGREQVISAYTEAIKKKYRFFSFGDAMLIY